MGSLRVLNAINARKESPVMQAKNKVKVDSPKIEAKSNKRKREPKVETKGKPRMKSKVDGNGLRFVSTTVNEISTRALVFTGATRELDLSVVPMDDYKLVLGMEFFDKVQAIPITFTNTLCILDGGRVCMVEMERGTKSGAKMMSAMQLESDFKELNKIQAIY
nr:Gag-Asp_proteas domain-containing protein [Tanacetum cinerariifolium]